MKYLVISSSQHKKDSNISHQPILATWVPPLSIVKLTSNCRLTVALNRNSPLVPMAAPNFNTLLNQLLQLHLLPTAAASCTDLSWRCTSPAQLCQGCSAGRSLHQLPHILAVQAILLWKRSRSTRTGGVLLSTPCANWLVDSDIRLFNEGRFREISARREPSAQQGITKIEAPCELLLICVLSLQFSQQRFPLKVSWQTSYKITCAAICRNSYFCST